jgi:hypothetical protein
MTNEQYENWANENNIFISKVYYRIRIKDSGLYILNSYKFRWLPKPFGLITKYYVECGINWLGWILEFQWSR